MTLRKSLSRISTQKGLRRKSEDVFGLVGLVMEYLKNDDAVFTLNNPMTYETIKVLLKENYSIND